MIAQAFMASRATTKTLTSVSATVFSVVERTFASGGMFVFCWIMEPSPLTPNVGSAYCPITRGRGEWRATVRASVGRARRREHLAHECFVASQVRTPQARDHLVMVTDWTRDLSRHRLLCPEATAVTWLAHRD